MSTTYTDVLPPTKSSPHRAIESLPVVEGVAFKVIVGFTGYAVGDDGSVWSCRRSFRSPRGEWVKLKPRVDKVRGRETYYRAHLGEKWYLVHRLVLIAFVGQPANGQEVRHLDGNSQNNRLTNLRWGTREENCKDKADHGTKVEGEKHPRSKLTADKVREIRRRRNEGVTIRVLAEEFGVCKRVIRHVVHRTGWRHVK